jgi:hypothetical protein
VNIEGDFVQTFLGRCMGVGLKQRGPEDLHVCLVILSEDDGNWFASDRGFSSHWTDDLLRQLQAARRWMADNCDPDGHYGWKFRE